MRPSHLPCLPRILVIALIAVLAFGGPAAQSATTQEATPTASPTAGRHSNPDDVRVPAGYRLDVVATSLNFPSDITFDDQGAAYIAETGDHTYGIDPESAPPGRIVRLRPDGSTEVVYETNVPIDAIREVASSTDMPEGLIGPVTGVTWHDGLLYVSHRSRVSTLDPNTGEFRTIINGLPSWGFFHNNKVIFGPDGKMYFFLSTQGNAGPIDEHWSKVINSYDKPEAHEVPCQDVTLTGENFAVPVENPETPDVDDTQLTGVYVPLGTETQSGQAIEGEIPCNGAFFRANPDGSDLELVAWGLRSDFAYRFAPDGRLIATQNSGNPIAPREIHDDWETIYAIEEGAWYGWPDYFSGVPVTDPRFAPKMEEHHFVLTEETHRQLLGDRDAPPQPLVKLQPHVVALGFVFGRPEFGIPEDEILLAEFGTNVVELRDQLPGFRVVRVNLETRAVSDFLVNTSGQPASVGGGGGLERPIQLEWGPDGVLYIVDFGVLNITPQGMEAQPGSGVIWRLQRTDGAGATPAAS